MLITPSTRAGRAFIGPAGIAALLALVAGCASPQPARTPHQVTVCGTSVATGAMQPVVQNLRATTPEPPMPPAPVLPVATAVAGSPAGVQYVRTSDSCDAGALVTVDPPANARLTSTFPASDGQPAAIGLLLTGPVVVRAWAAGHYQGSLDLGG
ncbi:hypothetical protein [Actinoplanes sp. NPDC026619]|uniref:hypothetical protein n=1 Tax=Actinoplanes sp. NPDC026619 TaxID=3155798 RepID=UPI0033F8678B